MGQWAGRSRASLPHLACPVRQPVGMPVPKLQPAPLLSPPPAAKSQQPCILLLDELDAMAPARAASHSEHERQATARLLAAVDELRASRCRVALVGATNQRGRVDGALRRAGRLDSEVALGALGEGERLAVLRCCTRRMPLAPCVDLPGTAARLQGYVAADVAAVASEAGLLCAAAAVEAAEAEGRLAQVEGEAFLAGLRVTAGHFEAAVERLGPAVLRGLAPEVPHIGWDDVGGLEVRLARCIRRAAGGYCHSSAGREPRSLCVPARLHRLAADFGACNVPDLPAACLPRAGQSSVLREWGSHVLAAAPCARLRPSCPLVHSPAHRRPRPNCRSWSTCPCATAPCSAPTACRRRGAPCSTARPVRPPCRPCGTAMAREAMDSPPTLQQRADALPCPACTA